jgi:hypothetical protein
MEAREFINSIEPIVLYQSLINSEYFIDKSLIIAELFKLIDTDNKYICVTRPRRFGKSSVAHMISSFFAKNTQGRSLFKNLLIHKHKYFDKHASNHNVVFIDFSKSSYDYDSFKEYRDVLFSNILLEAKNLYSNLDFSNKKFTHEIFKLIYLKTGERFIFVFDEWDSVFKAAYMKSLTGRQAYTRFLRDLLKDQAYVELVYMTGIIPIAKYSEDSDLNMFQEYNMAMDLFLSSSFGFTQTEVDCLFDRYEKKESNPALNKAALKFWYNGYSTASEQNVYNPLSVVSALKRNRLGYYWKKSGPYDSLYTHIKNERQTPGKPSIIDDIKQLINEEKPVKFNINDYIYPTVRLSNREEILTSLILHGLLSYSNTNKTVSIPNNELKFSYIEEIKTMKIKGDLPLLIKNSKALFEATKECDRQTMELLLTKAYQDFHPPRLPLTSEKELAQLVYKSYLYALNEHTINQEKTAGQGYSDILIEPLNNDDCTIIIELKFNKLPDSGLWQIKEKGYANPYINGFINKASTNGPIIIVAICFINKAALINMGIIMTHVGGIRRQLYLFTHGAYI